LKLRKSLSYFASAHWGKFQQGENHIGRVTSDETNAKQTHSETDCTIRGGENLFTNNNLSLTLNDGYLNNKGGIGRVRRAASFPTLSLCKTASTGVP